MGKRWTTGSNLPLLRNSSASLPLYYTSWSASTRSYDAAHILISTASQLGVLLPKLHGVHSSLWHQRTLRDGAVNIPPFSTLPCRKSLRTIQPFPNFHWKPKLSQIFIGKWGSPGPALQGTGFFESEKTGELRDKALSSTAGSHIWAAFLVD